MIHLDNERDCVVPDLCAHLLPYVPIMFMSARIIILDRFLRQVEDTSVFPRADMLDRNI